MFGNADRFPISDAISWCRIGITVLSSSSMLSSANIKNGIRMIPSGSRGDLQFHTSTRRLEAE